MSSLPLWCLHVLSRSVAGGRFSQLEGNDDQSPSVVNQHQRCQLFWTQFTCRTIDLFITMCRFYFSEDRFTGVDGSVEVTPNVTL